ncbi:hypothetical protein BCR33DRAFT_715415 [Rhizoclosmatium globosum]|uniref:Uncharacterized protein n=1 Tax=Rhizoclosmatium globosum TaxID=329046 RepID=A0A1Y2CJ28_9FUNG|nr:hypothetical protein BCR33DRAFT_715415 [Rhizoclosmatium globosum]|eukprot:ORY47043.1 hypothetical protein BCR33DRAFT_715415 [Rhizoclosmatium globosum]
MLYKSYIVTHQNKFFGICSILILVFRLGWSVTDAIWATGSWDYTQGVCIFNENATSGLFYTIADISADVIATAGAVIMFFLSGSYKLGLRSVSYLIARENILRSSVVLLFESFFLYATLVWKDAGAFQVLFTVQNLVYIFLMNMELVWKTVRDQEDVKSFICSGDDNQNTFPGAEKDDGGLGHTV